MNVESVEVILYVANQGASTVFYSSLLDKVPSLHVPGMTEFVLTNNVVLGLMPNAGIAKIIANTMPHPDQGTGIPRCELYLRVADADDAFHHALHCGALLVSDVANRDWGDRVGYVADPDGHIIAFAHAAHAIAP